MIDPLSPSIVCRIIGDLGKLVKIQNVVDYFEVISLVLDVFLGSARILTQ
jgi:hypothetical protein